MTPPQTARLTLRVRRGETNAIRVAISSVDDPPAERSRKQAHVAAAQGSRESDVESQQAEADGAAASA